jgi:hypothetical protein
MISTISRYERLSKRQLLKHLYQSWTKLRRGKVRRGAVMPSIEQIRPMLEPLFDGLAELVGAGS